MIFDFKVTDGKAAKLIIIGNKKTKRKYQFNDIIENSNYKVSGMQKLNSKQ